MAKIPNPEQVEYLVFQGGGGKGLAYLGALKALEEHDVLPFRPRARSESSGIKGVAGTSAGAITALLVALGYSANEIDAHFLSKPELFSAFFDGPDNGSYRTVSAFNTPGRSDRSVNIDLNQTVEAFIKKSRDMDLQNPLIRTLATALLGFLQSGSQYSSLLQQPAHEVLFMLLRGADTTTQNQALKGKLLGAGMKQLGGEFILYQLMQLLLPDTDPAEQEVFLKRISEKPFPYLYNLIFDRGLFPGFSIRDFFSGVIEKRFQEQFKIKIDGGSLDFATFFEHTKCHLLFTGTNVSTNRPHYFSKDHTPEFPVAEAAAISMNIPFVFKPVYVSGGPLEGFWTDGGTVYNLPLHAFDYLEHAELLSAHGKSIYGYLHPGVLALSLVEHLKGEQPEVKSWTEQLPVLNFASQMIEVLWEPDERQIAREAEREQIIPIPYGKLSTLNFTPGEALKKEPIQRAYEQVMKYFGN